jgi:hypothetical protein
MHFIIMMGKPKVLLYIYPKIKLDKLKFDKKKKKKLVEQKAIKV